MPTVVLVVVVFAHTIVYKFRRCFYKNSHFVLRLLILLYLHRLFAMFAF